ASFGDFFEAAAEREQKSCTREATFGEDADQIAAFEGFAGGLERLHDRPRARGGVDWDEFSPTEQVANDRFFRPAGEDDETNHAPLRDDEQQPVDVADVVANN